MWGYKEEVTEREYNTAYAEIVNGGRKWTI